ncbi:MAG: RDD family protein [Mucilaginibacter sp.]
MEIITVHTAQNIDIDYEIGGLGERILARLLDYAVFIPFLLAAIFIFPVATNTASGVYAIIIAALFVFYDLICEVFFNGQSIGKLIMKIRVISLDGARPKFSQYLLRWLFRLVDFGVTGGLGALVTSALNENGQRIGDIVAGTVMVRTEPRTKINNIVFNNTESSYQPVFSQAVELNDNDVALIHDVIDNYYKTGNNNIVFAMAEKVKNHLSITPPERMNSLVLLQTVIKDYSHISAQADAL